MKLETQKYYIWVVVYIMSLFVFNPLSGGPTYPPIYPEIFCETKLLL